MRFRAPLPLTLFLVGLLGCSSNPETNGQDPPGGDDFFVASEAVLDEVGARIEAGLADGASLTEAFRAAADYMAAQPVVETVEFTDKGDGRFAFVATFVNGAVFVMPIRWFEELPPTTAFDRRTDPLSAGLPASKTALFVDVPEFRSNVDKTSALLRRHGYDVTVISNPEVEDYAGIDGYDLVYIGTHGHYYEKDGVPHYALMTSTIRDPRWEDGTTIRVDVRHLLGTSANVVLWRGFSGIKTVPGSGSVDPFTQLAVNELFIQEYNGAFGDDSIFYADTCESTQRPQPDLPPPLLATLAGMNVSHYLGWDRAADNRSAVRGSNYLFTRLVGEVPDGLHAVAPLAPPIRAWPLHEAFSGAESGGFTQDEHGGARLEYMDLTYGQRASILVPVIDGAHVDVDVMRQTEELELSGVFGDREGHVHLCDQPPHGATLSGCSALSVVEWEDDEIVATYDGESHGDGHVVVDVDGRLGTATPLTEWRGEITVTGQLSAQGPDVNVTIDARFRAEVVDERTSPDDAPQMSFASNDALFGLDSRADYQFTGTFEDPAFIYTYTTNGRAMPNVDSMPAFHGAAVLDPEEGKATFQVTLVVQAMVRRTDKQTSLVETLPMPVAVPLFIEAELDPSGSISGGSTPLGSLTARWDTITPSTPPTDETPR